MLHAAEAKPPAKEAAGYRLIQKIGIPGDASYYDYVYADTEGRRVYVSFGGEVVVVDADSGEIKGRITGLQKVHGVALSLKRDRVFVTDGGADNIGVFDAGTLKAVGDVTAGKNPDAILFDSYSGHVLAFNHSGGTVTVVDADALKPVATIEVGGALEFGRADGKGTVWVNVEDKSEIARIDTKKNEVTARWPLAPCEEPTGMAFDAASRRLFVGCGNKMLAVVDASSGKVVAHVPIGPGVDAAEFDPKTKDVFASCGGDGSLVVIHQDGADRYHVIQNVVTQPRAKTLALDGSTHRVFVTAPTFAPAVAGPDGKPGRPAVVPDSFALFAYGK
jgi:DNA-binding beta-propeller fold protein YncE